MSVSLTWTQAIRDLELVRLQEYLPRAGRVLDFGAGTGQQALRLQNLGFTVDAVDVDSSPYLENRVFAVKNYDGRTLPFPDAHFDVVLSSNVLEHVQCVPETLRELGRVLKPGGVMLHVLPSSSWRLWSTLAEFIAAPRTAIVAAIRGPSGKWVGSARWRWTIGQLVTAIRPLQFRPHGERGCALTELWTFSRRAWCGSFAASECNVVRVVPLKLWYTGEALFGPRLSLSRRTSLAAWLGSATVLYVIRPAVRDVVA